MAKTEVFKDYGAFLDRPDAKTNGVTQVFADANSGWDEERGNEACWNTSRCSGCYDCSGCSGCSGCSRCSRCSGCSDCSDCSGCSRCSRCSGCSDCSGCSRCSDCSDCSGCSRCSGCSGCSRCSGCSGCYDCSGCSGLTENKPLPIPPTPMLANIHAAVFAAASAPDALNMSDWHTCETTHCRAGWVVHLAGDAGKKLERATTTLFAAMQIYKASSPIRVFPPRFFEKNEQALADMERCARLEQEEAARTATI